MSQVYTQIQFFSSDSVQLKHIYGSERSSQKTLFYLFIYFKRNKSLASKFTKFYELVFWLFDVRVLTGLLNFIFI